jgi:hypothetical protein
MVGEERRVLGGEKMVGEERRWLASEERVFSGGWEGREEMI